jgi:hypothetical protein
MTQARLGYARLGKGGQGSHGIEGQGNTMTEARIGLARQGKAMTEAKLD